MPRNRLRYGWRGSLSIDSMGMPSGAASLAASRRPAARRLLPTPPLIPVTPMVMGTWEGIRARTSPEVGGKSAFLARVRVSAKAHGLLGAVPFVTGWAVRSTTGGGGAGVD